MTTFERCVGYSQSSHFGDSQVGGRWREAEAAVGREGFRVVVKFAALETASQSSVLAGEALMSSRGRHVWPGAQARHARGPMCPCSRERIPPDSGFVSGRKDERKDLQMGGANPLILLPSAGIDFPLVRGRCCLGFLSDFSGNLFMAMLRRKERAWREAEEGRIVRSWERSLLFVL